jgi:hypothetical protein
MSGRHQQLSRIRHMLRESGASWTLEPGRRHLKVIVDGEQIGVLSYGAKGLAERDFYFVERALRERRKPD